MNFCASSLVQAKRPAFQPENGGASPTLALHIQPISKSQAAVVLKHHYLNGVSRGYLAKVIYGGFLNESLIGVCVFAGLSCPETAVGAFGLLRHEQDGLWELTRLCLLPEVQTEPKNNLASRLTSGSIRQLRKLHPVKAILSYADSAKHRGTVYQACNFQYYGLTQEKVDYWRQVSDGTLEKISRGPIKGWAKKVPRSRKHRYLLNFDPALKILWPKANYPK